MYHGKCDGALLTIGFLTCRFWYCEHETIYVTCFPLDGVFTVNVPFLFYVHELVVNTEMETSPQHSETSQKTARPPPRAGARSAALPRPCNGRRAEATGGRCSGRRCAPSPSMAPARPRAASPPRGFPPAVLQHSPATSFSGAAPQAAMDGHVHVLTRGPMVPLAADTLSSFGTVANVNALRDAMGLTKADPAAGDVAESLTAEVVVAEAAATEVETTTAIATVPAEASGVDEGMPPIATTVLSHPAGVTTAVPVSAQLMAQVTQEQLAAAYAAYGMSPPPPGAALQAMMMCQASYAAVVPGAAVAPPAKPVSSRRSGSVTKQGWSRDEDEKIMEAYKEKGARPAPLPRFHARALSMYTCVLNMDPNARALDAATRG